MSTIPGSTRQPRASRAGPGAEPARRSAAILPPAHVTSAGTSPSPGRRHKPPADDQFVMRSRIIHRHTLPLSTGEVADVHDSVMKRCERCSSQQGATFMKLHKWLAGLALAAGLLSTAAAAETIRFAVTDVEGMEQLQREYGGFVEELEKATGLEIEFTPVNNRTAAVEAMRAEQVDFVLTGPAEYVVFAKLDGRQARCRLAPPGLFRPDRRDGRGRHQDDCRPQGQEGGLRRDRLHLPAAWTRAGAGRCRA